MTVRERVEGKMDYRVKKSRMREKDCFTPVITTVLYLGNGYWKGKKKLSELFRTEEFLKLKEDTEWAIAVHIDRKKLTVKMEKEGLRMCQAFDELMKDKKAEGKKEERARIIRHMMQEGMEQNMIQKITKCSKSELAAIAAGCQVI